MRSGLRAGLVLLWQAGCLPGAWAAMGSDGHWHVGIGDPSVMGWVTVVAYGLAAWLCVRAAQRLQPARFWWLVALIMLALGLNKQLDLQSWLTDLGRQMARQEGWYEHRHRVQVAFVAAMGVLLGGAGLVLGLAVMAHWRRLALTWCGLLLLTLFIVVRAASFHHVDALLLSTVGGLRLNWCLELGGIGLICLGAWRALTRHAEMNKSP